MTSYKLLSLSAAGVALAFAQGASAQNYNVSGNGYEFAVPAQHANSMAPPVMAMPQQGAPRIAPMAGYQNFNAGNAPMMPMAQPQMMQPQMMQHMAPQMQAPQMQTPQMNNPQFGANFDRKDWLKQCSKEVRQKGRGLNAGVGPGLVTAAIGGVVGNRIYKKERLAGALIGGGAGGLLGLALGSLVSSISDKREAHKYCTSFLDNQMRGQNQQASYGNYSQAQQMQGAQMQNMQMYQNQYQGQYQTQMVYIPVMIQVPQRAVVRETVEYVDVPRQAAPQQTMIKEVVIERVVERQAEPVRSKRLKYIKHR